MSLKSFETDSMGQGIFTIGKIRMLKSSILVSFSRDAVEETLPANTGETGSIPGSGRYPGVGSTNPLQYSYLGNPMNKSLVGCSARGCKQADITEHVHTREH